MAHEIDTTTGRAAVFVTGEPAWHKLGINVSTAQTSDEAIKLAALDWSVEPKNLAAAVAAGQWAPVADRVANVRTDTNAVLGIVGHTYRVFQNREAFDFMDELVGEKLAMFETAGSLKGGRRVWMLARIPGEYRVGSDDLVKPYVLLTNTHDGTQTLRMIPTTVRVVCQNTLNLALGRAGNSEGLSIWHTESLKLRIEAARRNLGIITKRMSQFGDELLRLSDRQLAGNDLGNYFRAAFNVADGDLSKHHRKIMDQLWANLDNERNTLPGIRHTAWAAYNAVSEYVDHQSRVTGNSPEAKADNRLSSIWFGTGAKIKQRAYEQALALAV